MNSRSFDRDKVFEKTHELQGELIEKLKESIRIPSVQMAPVEGKPYGTEVDNALKHAIHTAAELGFRTGEGEGQYGWCEYGEGAEMIAVLGHLDVVPAGEGWKHGPFDADITDGIMWGRGTMDDKGPVFASLYALKAIADLKIPLKRRIRIIFGTNEETGCKDIPHYLEKEELPVYAFTPDAEFPVIYAEKGICQMELEGTALQDGAEIKVAEIRGGLAPNIVPDACSALIRTDDIEKVCRLIDKCCSGLGAEPELTLTDEGDLRIRVHGRSAHGSIPEQGDNAVCKMLKILRRLELSTDLRSKLSFLADKVGADTEAGGLGLSLSDEIGRISLNVGKLDYDGERINVVLDTRIPVTRTSGEFTEPFKAIAENSGFKLRILLDDAPLYQSKDSFLVRKLMDVYHEYQHDGEAIAIGGGTYAKKLPNTVAFGPMLPGREDLNHQANEYIFIKELEMLTQIYAHAMVELANG